MKFCAYFTYFRIKHTKFTQDAFRFHISVVHCVGFTVLRTQCIWSFVLGEGFAWKVCQGVVRLLVTQVPEGPLTPMTSLIFPHSCLLSASLTAFGNVQLHHSVMSSLHFLGDLSCTLLTPTMSISFFTSLSSGIRYM